MKFPNLSKALAKGDKDKKKKSPKRGFKNLVPKKACS